MICCGAASVVTCAGAFVSGWVGCGWGCVVVDAWVVVVSGAVVVGGTVVRIVVLLLVVVLAVVVEVEEVVVSG